MDHEAASQCLHHVGRINDLELAADVGDNAIRCLAIITSRTLRVWAAFLWHVVYGLVARLIGGLLPSSMTRTWPAVDRNTSSVYGV
jgi:hypothetical protein